MLSLSGSCRDVASNGLVSNACAHTRFVWKNASLADLLKRNTASFIKLGFAGAVQVT